MVVDLGVHERLRESRLIQLVVAVTAVAIQVYHNIPIELLSVFDGQLEDAYLDARKRYMNNNDGN